MQTKKRPRGRPREFAGVVRAQLSDAHYDYVMAEIERTDRPQARVVRELIAEAIENRQKQGR